MAVLRPTSGPGDIVARDGDTLIVAQDVVLTEPIQPVTTAYGMDIIVRNSGTLDGDVDGVGLIASGQMIDIRNETTGVMSGFAGAIITISDSKFVNEGLLDGTRFGLQVRESDNTTILNRGEIFG